MVGPRLYHLSVMSRSRKKDTINPSAEMKSNSQPLLDFSKNPVEYHIFNENLVNTDFFEC